jgi:hypothetical protein
LFVSKEKNWAHADTVGNGIPCVIINIRTAASGHFLGEVTAAGEEIAETVGKKFPGLEKNVYDTTPYGDGSDEQPIAANSLPDSLL